MKLERWQLQEAHENALKDLLVKHKCSNPNHPLRIRAWNKNMHQALKDGPHTALSFENCVCSMGHVCNKL